MSMLQVLRACEYFQKMQQTQAVTFHALYCGRGVCAAGFGKHTNRVALQQGPACTPTRPLCPLSLHCNIFQFPNLLRACTLLGERLGGGHSPHSFALLGYGFDCFWGG